MRGRFTVCRLKDGEGQREGMIHVFQSFRCFIHTHHIGSSATCLEDMNGVVRLDIVHRCPIDHDNLIFGTVEQTNTRVGPHPHSY